MAIIFYGLKTCDTCKKALRSLIAAGLEVTVVDVRADGVPTKTLTKWLKEVGSEALVNTRSTTWRGLPEEARAGADTPEGARALLIAHPTLMKRPIVVSGGALYVGWTPAARAALLG